MSEPIRITTSDLHAPEVTEYVELQSYLRREVGMVGDQPWLIRVVYANWFYLAVSCALGGLAGWALLEPWFDDNQPEDELDLAAILLFPVVAASIGLFLGGAEGIICRNLSRAVKCGAVGLGIGFIGGLVALIPTGILFMIMSSVALRLWDNPQPDAMPNGLALLVLMMGRAGAWGLAAIPAGIGQGIALRESDHQRARRRGSRRTVGRIAVRPDQPGAGDGRRPGDL